MTCITQICLDAPLLPVEEMKNAKVYMQTVRNMWISSALFNPLISLCAMAVMPM